MSSVRLAARETRVSLGAPIESSGRRPIWSSARADELEQSRDDVDGQPAIAAGSDALEQLLVRRTGEGEDHPVDALLLENVDEVVEPAEMG